jgi:hypothetical protein
MFSHLTSGVYYPEILTVMGDALDIAWKKFRPVPKNAALARTVMASAIIEAVEARELEPAIPILVDKATRALRAAIKEDPEALNAVAARRTRWRRLPLARPGTLLQSAQPSPAA